MFCPKCATQNADGASFCRSCGANISMVSMAVNGQLTQSPPATPDLIPIDARKRQGPRKIPTQAEAIKQLFIGLGFVFVTIALAFSITGTGWWYWMLIPAFSCIGNGVSMLFRARELQGYPKQVYGNGPASLGSQPQYSGLPPRDTGELYHPPPSVTEGTTRHLGVEAPTRHLANTPGGEESAG
ncbi:MAG: zinc-ribbon domain [Blastocatellia bacterium]|jgi:hypothetical protein|nr:zinc-ribbon domain [Blastocatellia bacterium]